MMTSGVIDTANGTANGVDTGNRSDVLLNSATSLAFAQPGLKEFLCNANKVLALDSAQHGCSPSVNGWQGWHHEMVNIPDMFRACATIRDRGALRDA